MITDWEKDSHIIGEYKLTKKQLAEIRTIFHPEWLYYGHDGGSGYSCDHCKFGTWYPKEAYAHVYRGCQLELFGELKFNDRKPILYD